MTTSKCSNGNPGCLRGFVREKCHKCRMGSTACNMCHSNLSSLMAHHSQPPQTTGTFSSSCTQHNRNSSSSSTSSSSSSTSSCSTSSTPSPESSPRNSVVDPSPPNSAPRALSLTVKTLSISYQLPLPSGHPQRSLVSNSPTLPSPSRDFSIAILALPTQLHPATAFASSSSCHPSSPISPTTPTTHILPSPSSSSFPSNVNANPSPYAQYGPSSPCIFCFNGRKACEECFGLGYVQRICQDCLRDKHKSQRRRNSHSAHSGTASSSSSSSKSLINPAVSASWIQFSHKLKEQFSFGHHHHQQQEQEQQHHEVDSRRDVEGEDKSNSISNSKGKSKNKQVRKEKKQRSKSMISLPLVRTLSLTRASSTTNVHQTQTSSPSSASPLASPTLGPVHEEELLEDSQGTDPDRVNTSLSVSNLTGESAPLSRAKKSFKATVLSALKVPLLFHTHNVGENTSGPSGNGRTGTNIRPGTGTDTGERTGTTTRQPHRRQWSLPTISLPTASIAA